ncbi:GNAT family N-acetyltransferase [Elizabethkingia meningoseptica]|uniref:GNAT family N-acetyltransferase n=1 Tax=Elizabethkingia meningoseptica TaxID=238 RepID=UPI002011229F|nr:GNAT family N-acetyltransferase [Elizabethkingia meningoseptica]MCL1677041.1 GNAT family N-acetyltransferase [Elizabethkingia meningoseptica]MCL1688145.1 GNAT family N-acetyltransferase [Elizabethkingia meningoseptica]MDE5439751.1 GNAT family N-acetyltransferase [Elizabethkingia meningoseptica]MDE5494001.1 GNAT family N-acetyltransferase [Elizabethkingia meningoseptica]MDE5510511.1 GNAT family N-acetyltransferase [Elizabethkingia meningoseptica]
MSFPVIETERLILRQLTQDDAADMFEYFSKDEVTIYYDLYTFKKIEEAEDLIRQFNNNFENKKGIRWAIQLKEGGKMIGTCGYHNWFPEHFKAEVGYELNPGYWRKHYMQEALEAILPYAFSEMQLHRIDAFTDPANEASEKILLKLDFKEEGLLRDFFFEKGRFVDAKIFGLIK